MFTNNMAARMKMFRQPIQRLVMGNLHKNCGHPERLNRCWKLCSQQARPLTSVPNSDKQYTVVTEKDGIRKIHLNDPKKRNALSLAMLQSLKRDLLHKSADQELRVIILSAEGPVFSSGHDLKELTSATGREFHRKVFDACTEVMLLLQEIHVPVIAQVAGLATAAGCQLVASCDIAVASEKARFGTPGAKVGLFCSTPGVALGRAVPRKVAMEMLFTGDTISAQDALQHGLISKIVPEDKLEEETQNVARKICEYSSSVIALGKSCFYSQMRRSREDAYREASQVMIDNLSLKDGQEGIHAFIKKGHPTWSHSWDKAHD
ncbi:Enoyl-CoA hydratase domain-containing protein 3, mitochondrial [Holothuria leucospilota]|uniref:Enoyl-CoA hydratase domain-containing protein 3, mitochondrial n=1 Tax=Holothuria leucospilota TaxID=206669 RepID=A0A9Q0YDT0_HOLLE|nr:Enoyl-CoA hydratase domain-containing protein 3, mitochondrial [Holothuria leucospilota]